MTHPAATTPGHERRARAGAKRVVRSFAGRAAIVLAAVWTAPLLHAATATVEGSVLEVLATGDGRFGGCMAALDVALADAGLDCPGRWVSFSCTGEHAGQEDADRVFESLRAAVVSDKSVEMLVTDEKKQDGYCHASRIKIQDAPHVDEDSDGDGVFDLDDDVPLDASETVDTDDDGVGNNADPDDDNDGLADAVDPCPLDENDECGAVVPPGMPASMCEVELDRSSAAGGTESVALTLSDAREAPVGTSNVAASLDASMADAHDVDVYRIDLRTSGRLTVVSAGSFDMQALLLADDCTAPGAVSVVQDLGRLQGVPSNNLNFGAEGDLARGAYYLVVFEWAGRTGDYAIRLLFDDPTVNDAPVIAAIPDQEIAPGDSATLVVRVADDRGDTSQVTAESDNLDVATVTLRRRSSSLRTLVINGAAEGTATISVDATDQYGADAATVTFDAVVRAPTLAAPTVETGEGGGELDVTFAVMLGPSETRAYDYQLRRKAPQSPWGTACVRWRNNVHSARTSDVTWTFTGLSPGVTIEVRYRDRNSSSCAGGSPGRWSAAAEGRPRTEVRRMDLDSANRNPTGIAHINGMLYVVDGIEDRVYAYTTSGERDAEADFDLAAENRVPNGITAADGRLYVADSIDDKVYVYDASGSRDEDSEFDLHGLNGSPSGIAYANGKFHVVDSADDKVYVYAPSGVRDEGSEFDLGPRNRWPSGMTFGGGRFYVVDLIEEEVYAYDAAGRLEPGLGLDLEAENNEPEGVVHARGSLYVVDDAQHRIFVYAVGGGTPGSPLIFLEAPAAERVIPENLPGGVDVGLPVSATGADALTYTIAGPDAASFDIVAETGQLRTSADVFYDYETKNSYAVEVVVADDAGNRESLDVTIDLLDLAPACGSLDGLGLRINSGDGRLTVRWNPLRDRAGHARIQGYQTEIRRGSGPWADRRTFLGRSIVGSTYSDLDNGVGYEIRVRPINAEGDCEWSVVSGMPTRDLAPRNDREFDDRFGPHPIGPDDRNFRQVLPGRCRHTSGGVNRDASCTYNQEGPDAGRFILEFDDPSKGSCDVAFAYASLTAGSFIDECFGAGVNVQFDRSFRMPDEAPDGDAGAETPRAPRTEEEFIAFAWGREDLIPGLGFGCPPVVAGCGDPTVGASYTIERHSDTGSTRYRFFDHTYTYENTGPSSGVVSLHTDDGHSFEFALEFEASGAVRTTITGSASRWPGMPHLDLTLGAQSVLLPIPPSWSAIALMETEFAPDDLGFFDGLNSEDGTWESVLFGSVWDELGAGPDGGLIGAGRSVQYSKIGRNRATITMAFEDKAEIPWYESLDEFQRQHVGSTWTFDMTFLADGVAEVTVTVRKAGRVPAVFTKRVDFHGDNLDEFPVEAFLPDEAPQAAAEDVAGVEVAAAINVEGIGSNDLQTFLVSASGEDFEPGDWLEPKDGGDQRMMIVGAGSAASAVGVSSSFGDAPSASAAVRFDTGLDTWPYLTAPKGRAMAPRASAREFFSRAASSAELVQLTVVCMQGSHDIPTRGARYFSKAKAAAGDVQSCQKDCVLEGGANIQGCVWNCED